jgi:hypothetical protein
MIGCSKMQYQTELESLALDEKERMMEVTILWKEPRKEGFLQGLEQGKQKGKREGMASLITHQMVTRFGAIDEEILRQIDELNSNELERLGDALWSFSNLKELTEWLRAL